jgi:hypothetical protein
MKIQVDRERIGAQQQSAGAQINAKLQDTQAQITAKQDQLAAKLGIDVAMKESEREHLRGQSNQQQDHAKFLAERQHQQAERQAQRTAQTKGGEVGGKKPEGFKEGGVIHSDYDMEGYKAAVKSGKIKPRAGEEDHYPDTYKLPNHPTFSEQSKYSNADAQGGKWQKGEEGRYYFHPSEHNLKNKSPEKLSEYFVNQEKKGTHLVLPTGELVEGTK